MLNVVKICDLDYNNTGAYKEYYVTEKNYNDKNFLPVDEDHYDILLNEGRIKQVNIITLHE